MDEVAELLARTSIFANGIILERWLQHCDDDLQHCLSNHTPHRVASSQKGFRRLGQTVMATSSPRAGSLPAGCELEGKTLMSTRCRGAGGHHEVAPLSA
jgi:hypothetical protein